MALGGNRKGQPEYGRLLYRDADRAAAGLTAAHCLYDRRTGTRVKPVDLHFLAGYRRGEFLAHAAAVSVIVPDGYSYGTGTVARIGRSSCWRKPCRSSLYLSAMRNCRPGRC